MTADLDRSNTSIKLHSLSRSLTNGAKNVALVFAGQSHTPADIDELESAYRILPLIFGCIIPVSILINVPSLTSPWVAQQQYNPQTETWSQVEISIPHWIEAMVIVALTMAVICNVCVLSRFLERNIWHSVVLSLITASIQDVLSIGAIVPFCLKYRPSNGYYYLEGFWAMIASMIFSLTATVLMSIDFHRTPNFRLQGSGVTHKQRMLIAQAMTLCFYLAIGALIMIWIEGWSFLESLFFGMITITTIGFGDTTPKTSGGRVFVVFYGAGGIVLFAMAVNAIRYVILEDLHRQFALRAKERKAKREARKRERKILEQEKQKRLKETLERVQQLRLEDNHNTVNGTSQPHHFSILHRHLAVPRGNTILSLFSKSTNDNPEPKSGEFSCSTLEGDVTLGAGVGTKDEPSLLEMIHRQNTESNSKDNLQVSAFESDTINQPVEDNVSLGAPSSTPEDEVMPPLNHKPYVEKRSRLVSIYRKLRQFLGFKTSSRVEALDPCQTPKEQRETDRKLAYQESMEEYSRRLRFSFVMFISFWLIGAGLFTAMESWSYGEAMYFSFVAFSTIGYGDVVPRTNAGRSIFLVYCLVGVVTLTSLASLISEVLSKTMRRHVVETQMKRSERFIRLGIGQRHITSDIDLEQGDGGEGAENEFSSDDGLQSERIRNIHNLISSQTFPEGENQDDSPSDRHACKGSLQNLVQVTRDLDIFLQKVLDHGHQQLKQREGGSSSTTESIYGPSLSATQSIYDYLEKEEDENSLYLSPSISRDVTSTSSIQRQAMSTLSRSFRNIQPGGTYHGSGYSSSSSESPFNITAWPTFTPTGLSANADKVKKRPSSSNGQLLSPVIHDRHKQLIQPKQHTQHSHHRFDHPSRPQSVQGISLPHQRNSDGSVTINAAHWQQLVEYSATFRALTDTCEETLKRFLVWETNEKKRCLRRRRTRDRQKRILLERRRRLYELGGSYGAIDDGIEDEDELEEELDEWDEEGSIDDDDGAGDKSLDEHRENIANVLLGATRPNVNHHHHHHHRSRHSSRTRQQQHEAPIPKSQPSKTTHTDKAGEHEISADDSSATQVPALTDGHSRIINGHEEDPQVGTGEDPQVEVEENRVKVEESPQVRILKLGVTAAKILKTTAITPLFLTKKYQ
ncbi:hypothetical protein BGZ49_001374 [Haplosporangium sp. Z 27]|nr:hypothetical protein BGZ49_001374 [Haplosporangium sp. Z 27]